MKKRAYFVFVLVLFLFAQVLNSNLVFAENDKVNTYYVNTYDNSTGLSMGLKREARRREKMREFTEKAKERITAYLEKEMKRLSALFNKEETSAEKIYSRLNELADKGVDTTKTEILFAVAYDEIEKGRAAIAEVEIMIIEMTALDTYLDVRKIFTYIENHKNKINEAAKNAKSALFKARIATKDSAGMKDTDIVNESAGAGS